MSEGIGSDKTTDRVRGLFMCFDAVGGVGGVIAHAQISYHIIGKIKGEYSIYLNNNYGVKTN